MTRAKKVRWCKNKIISRRYNDRADDIEIFVPIIYKSWHASSKEFETK